MYNKDIIFHSGRDYPTIARSGSRSFSKGTSPAYIEVTSAAIGERYLLILEVGGYRSIIGADTANLNRVYWQANAIRVYLDDYNAYSGTIYWRVYGD